MNIIEATRAWLRSSDLIDKDNKFNAGYLGASATEYSIASSGESHRTDILGNDLCSCSLIFSARMPYGAAIQENISAADFFSQLSAWIRKQNRAHNYPDVAGYDVTEIMPSNAGIIIQADANTAKYQIQIKINLEEVRS